MIEITRLRVFREVARRGSFTAAAAALGYAQPSISNQIAQLEREVGVQLVDRSPRRLALTPAGEVLAGHVEAVLLRLEDAQREVRETARIGARRLRVAAFPTAAATVLPPAVAAFRRQLPGVELCLVEADPPAALPALLAGEHDLALSYDYPLLAAPAESELELEPLFVDTMAVAVPAGHDLSRLPEVPLAALADQPMCAPHDSRCRDALELASRQAGFTPRVVSETNDYMAMQGLVAAGVGVAVLPRLACAIAVRPGVVVRPLGGSALERLTFTVHRAGGYRPPATEAMRAALRAAVAAVGHPALPLETLDTPAAHAAEPVLPV